MSNRLDRHSLFLYGVTLGSNLPEPLPLTMAAVAFAHKCHRNEMRDDGEPYILHPITACNTLITLGVHKDRILAAVILHDVVENDHTDLAAIREEFGEEVANLVDIQTRRENEEPEPYYARISSDIGGILCKAADRLHNITNMIDVFDLLRLKRYVDQTESYVLPMLKSVRYSNLEYANALVILHDSIRNIVIVAKRYIEAMEKLEMLEKS